jgi:uracil phosphoribosyltransferase
MKNVRLVDHPVVHDCLARLRDRSTGPELFADAIHRLSLILAVEAAKDLPVRPVEVVTPFEKADGYRIDMGVCLVPILRAGLSMVDAFREVFSGLIMGYVGLVRREGVNQVDLYMETLPDDLTERYVWVLDTSLATGLSACAAIREVKKAGGTRIGFACCLAAPEGVRRAACEHPDVSILAAFLDRELDAQGRIIPGFGNAGDRLAGTTSKSSRRL